MTRFGGRPVLSLLLALILVPAHAAAQARPGATDAPPPAWELVGRERSAALQSDDVVVRSRSVAVDFQTWRTADLGSWIAAPGLDGSTQRLLVDGVEYLEEGNVAITGSFPDDPVGVWAAVLAPDLLVANLRGSFGTYQLRSNGPDGHELRQIDESRFAPCATGRAEHSQRPAASNGQRPGPGGGTTGGGIQTRADDGSTFDVLVMWTVLAQNAAGGIGAMTALVDLAIAETNQAYAASLVGSKVRLVYKGNAGYNEGSSFGGHLNLYSGKSDGVLDHVHAIRDAVGADLCVLLVNDGAYCGIAYLMTNVSNGFEDRAFSVTNWGCATGYYSFGHELGHNMGCAHDHDNGSNGAYSYSFGHRFHGNGGGQYRTVMAYSPGTRIGRFSNPNTTFDGVPTGVSGGSEPAENARSINNASSVIANWRQERLSVTTLYFSPRDDEIIQGTPVAQGDVAALDLVSGNVSLIVDLSDVVPGSQVDVNGMFALDDGTFLFTFRQATTVPGLVGGPAGDQVEQNDLVRFVPTSLGANTSGSFEFYFDGSDVELDTWQEDLDSLSMDDSGNLLMTFRGTWTIQGGTLSGQDEDVVVFTPTSLGAVTSGSFSILMDGSDSDVRLHAKGEDVDALHYHVETGDTTVSVNGTFRVPIGQKGDDNDLLTFIPQSYGVPTTGTFRFTLDAQQYGLGGVDFDAIHVVP